MNIEKSEKIIFLISGGVGKNIMATAVIEALRKQFPKKQIIVATPWPIVWLNNPNVNEIVDFTKESDLYKNHINKDGSVVLMHDPYFETNFVYRKKHLIQIWCEMFNIKYNNETPKLFFTEEENESVRKKLPSEKPLFFIQTSGGAENQEYPISWMRDMPLTIAQDITNEMISKGYDVIHLRRENQYLLLNTTRPDMNLREILCAIQFSDKRLFIDSVAQHAAAALNKESVVTWIGNKPEIFGYKIHKNILPKAEIEFRHYINSYLEKYNIAGVLYECPYNTNEIFDKDEILKNLF